MDPRRMTGVLRILQKRPDGAYRVHAPTVVAGPSEDDRDGANLIINTPLGAPAEPETKPEIFGGRVVLLAE